MRFSTERLLIRPLEMRDMPQLLAMLKSDVVKRTYMIPDFPTEEAAAELAKRLITLSEGKVRLVAGIALGEELIGFVNETQSGNGSIELGYVIRPDQHGRGYMTEALCGVIAELFAMGYSRVTAGAFEENLASIRVMEKCAMMRQTHTESVEYRGRLHRCVYYAIERAEESR